MRKRLRVCLAIDVYDIGGGVARIYRKILEHIDLTRFEPILLVLLKEVSEAVPENVQLVRIGTSRARHAIFPLIKVFKTLKPDVVLASKEAVNLAVIVAKKLSKVESKIVVSQHTHLGAQLKYEKGGWFKKKFIPLLMRLLYPYADKVLTVSKAGAQSLRDILGLDAEKVLSLYNPVVDDSILQLAKEEVQHPWFRQDCKEPTIIAVGRLVREKNFSLLLDAMALVCKQIPCNLAIFGEGEEKQELIRQAERLGLSNRVKFMGLVSNPFKYMAKADIFVLSSLWEGLPTALIEAMACGTAVVSTACPSGPEEIIKDKQSGLLVPVGDKEKLAEAILLLLKNTELRKRLGANAARRAQDFSVDKVVKAYEELFVSLVDRR